MTAISLPTLFVGDAEREDFRDTAQWLIDRGAVAATDIAEAIAVVRSGFAPALIVISQSWTGQLSTNEIAELRRAAPLARIIRLLGTWSEGEGRTGKPWPATMRANWQRWNSTNANDLPRLSQPLTAGEDDRLLAACHPGEPNLHVSLGQVIATYAHTRETAESLDDLFSQRGWSTIWIRSANAAVPGNADCAVFDARDNSATELELLAALRKALGETPIIALVGFPRIDDLERFQTAGGASAIVGKPYLADDLLSQIEKMLPQDAPR